MLTKSTELFRRTSQASSLLNRLSRSESSGSLRIPTKACTICATETDTALYPDLSLIPNTCQTHCADICISCFKISLAADISEKPTHHISCPACDVEWGRPFLEPWVTEAELEPYGSKKLIRDLETDPDFRGCQSQACNGRQLYSGGEGEPMMTCGACGFISCYTRKVAWHASLLCTKYDDMFIEEREKEKAARIAEEGASYRMTFGKEAMSCPECKHSFSRESGCHITTCTFKLSNPGSRPIRTDHF